MSDNVHTVQKGDDSLVTPSFKAREFDCPCGECSSTLISEELLLKLQAIRDQIAAPLHINSGYRCPAHQAALTSEGYETATPSQHELGCAADIQAVCIGGAALETIARACGFKAVGVGQTWIHVDTRSDKDRRWEYKRS